MFKNAFLPYRDSETLSLFLKEIDWFSYDNSENLGNAFEYLLSILGSQGDAGQFRTPRHIIDFIVEVLDPKKDESVLDPACGTAGFLISAYKHIIKNNSKNYDSKNPEYSFAREEENASSIQIQSNGKYKGEKLKQNEKRELQKNFQGYDISPDMVKLSLVNMYLHKFKEPKIIEYNTLTCEKRWSDEFDIILANPPFMTPKGGMKTHSKFSIQANRSEVLFVDYIAEHLTLNGRAGIIVPEGIIFKSDKAYKSLRKMLVEDNFLWAVVSLPAKVFEPYSGVKTSILFLDRKRAKKNNEILFVDVQNDGFELGANRRKIEENDLLEAFESLKDWSKEKPRKNDISFLVKKKKIGNDNDYNLSANLYRTKKKIITKWPMVKLEELLDYEQPTNYIVESTHYKDEYKTPVLTAGKSFILGYTNEEKSIFPKNKLPVIIFDDFTTATKFVNFSFKVKSSAMKILLTKKKKAYPLFVYLMMQKIDFDSSTHKRYWISKYSQIKIPLPPLSIQKEVIDEIDGYQKIIDGAKQIVNNWKPTFKTDSKWSMMKLGEVCEIFNGSTPKRTEKGYWEKGTIPWFTIEDIRKQGRIIKYTKQKITKSGFKNSSLKLLPRNTVLLCCTASVGEFAFFEN